MTSSACVSPLPSESDSTFFSDYMFELVFLSTRFRLLPGQTILVVFGDSFQASSRGRKKTGTGNKTLLLRLARRPSKTSGTLGKPHGRCSPRCPLGVASLAPAAARLRTAPRASSDSLKHLNGTWVSGWVCVWGSSLQECSG